MKKDPHIKHFFKLTLGGQFEWYLAKYMRSERDTITVKILKRYYDPDENWKKGEDLSIFPKDFHTVSELVDKKDKLFPMLFNAVGGN